MTKNSEPLQTRSTLLQTGCPNTNSASEVATSESTQQREKEQLWPKAQK